MTEARRLAHLNRYKTRPSSVVLFRQLKLPLASEPNTWLDFHEASQLIRQPKAILVTDKVLHTALKQDDRKNARILLMAYMIMMCPKEIFQRQRKEEQNLHESARDLLLLFETWLCAHGRQKTTHARHEFVKAWCSYSAAFDHWKSRDLEKLIKDTIAYYVQLWRLQQTMADQDHSSVLQEQLEQIKIKLERLGGARALEDLASALERASALAKERKKKQEKKQEQKTRKPDTLISHDEMDRILSRFTNSSLDRLKVAHELILNPEFTLETMSSALETQIKEVVERAYFDHLEGDFYRVLKDLKERLLSLAKGSLIQRVEETMDMAFIEQQIKQNALDFPHMIQKTLDLLSNMCAPIRDPEIKEIRQITGKEQVKSIYRLCDRMELDLANFTLRSIRPPFMEIAVDYERSHFAELLNNGSIQLVTTQAWLKESCIKLCEVAASRNPENVPQPTKRPRGVFEEAFVSLLLEHQPRPLPETLFLDAERISEFQNEIQAITMVAALLMLARNFGRSTPQKLTALSQRLFKMLEDRSTEIDHLAVEIERAVSVREDRKGLIRNMVDKTLSHSDTVYSLLSRRVALVIKSTIQQKQFVSDAVMMRHGLEHVQTNLQQLTERIYRFAQHHREVYGSLYDEVMED
ncbi:unnamed protein product [Rhizopus stolonifer]